MHLSDSLRKRYTTDTLSALQAMDTAEFIAWGPAIFQAARLMLKYGIFQLLADAPNGLTRAQIVEKTTLSDYAVKCLLDASLCSTTVIVDADTEAYKLSKAGWFLLNDRATRANIDFNHDVNYRGWYDLDKSLENGRPEGLKTLGNWATIYEGLSELAPDAQRSWFGFDHFYSDSSFPEALRIVFDENHVTHLYDVGGNTGKWALRCVDYNEDVRVTILDLPQQIGLMKENVRGKKGAERIDGYGINLLDEGSPFPQSDDVDAIWMSQFLDCFSMPQITSILTRARQVMSPNTRIYIMETLWDRQRFTTAAMCLTMTSLYFSAMANGNSKMYNTEDMEQCIHDAGLEVEKTYDNLGQGHSILVCKLKN